MGPDRRRDGPLSPLPAAPRESREHLRLQGEKVPAVFGEPAEPPTPRSGRPNRWKRTAPPSSCCCSCSSSRWLGVVLFVRGSSRRAALAERGRGGDDERGSSACASFDARLRRPPRAEARQLAAGRRVAAVALATCSCWASRARVRHHRARHCSCRAASRPDLLLSSRSRTARLLAERKRGRAPRGVHQPAPLRRARALQRDIGGPVDVRRDGASAARADSRRPPRWRSSCRRQARHARSRPRWSACATGCRRARSPC